MTTPSSGDPYGQQPYGGGQYGQTDPGYAAAPQKPKNGMGLAALILGILALVSILIVWIPFVGILTIVLALLAVIFGVIGRRRVKAMRATNGGVALTGLILGVLMLLLGIVAQVLGIVFSVAFLNSGGAETLQQFQQCVTQAQQAPNPAAVQQAAQQCTDQFGQQLPQFGGGGG